ncbi:MAG TPA: 20S proteasome subunit A/B [Polyangia bacterium]|nr:20S proteasome subunit A/B [Polyangia bacterium]
MTYCLAVQVEAGIAFAADTRSNAGVDYVTSYSKLHCFRTKEGTVVALLSAGSLATTQEVVSWMQRDLDQDNSENLNHFSRMFEAAAYVGRVSQAVQESHRAALAATGVSAQATFILGGQIRGEPPSIYLIYPEGNFIRASADTPYLQVGETKYGKPILDRLVDAKLSLPQATRLAVLSLNATIKSNLSVGPPLDLGIYRTDSFHPLVTSRLDEEDPYYAEVNDGWNNALKDVFFRLPDYPWDKPGGR